MGVPNTGFGLRLFMLDVVGLTGIFSRHGMNQLTFAAAPVQFFQLQLFFSGFSGILIGRMV